jgi:hypothetical protein
MNWTRCNFHFFACIFLLTLGTSSLHSQQTAETTAQVRMRTAILSLMSHYNATRGLWKTEACGRGVEGRTNANQ